MLAVDLIRKKRDGGALSRAEIDHFIHAVTAGSLPDYQASALLMAVVLRGMSPEETAALTDAMVRSGVRVEYPGLPSTPVDQHSTGGGGDRRLRADDVGPRPRPYGRHARQARVDPRLPHRPLARRVARRRGDDRV